MGRPYSVPKPPGYHYSNKDGRAQIIVHLHGIERQLISELQQEQVRHLSKKEIRQLYPNGRYPADRLRQACTPSIEPNEFKWGTV